MDDLELINSLGTLTIVTSSLISIAVTILVIVRMDPIMLGYVILTPILRRSYLVASAFS